MDWPLSAKEILLGAGVPLAAGAGMLFGLRLMGWRCGTALVVAGATLAGHWLLVGRPGLPPADAVDYLFPCMFAATLLADVIGDRVGVLSKLAFAVVGAGVTGWLLLRPLHLGNGLAVPIAIGAGFWLSFNVILSRSPGAWAGCVMTGTAGCAATVLMMSDSLRIGETCLALTGAVAGLWLAGSVLKLDIWRPAAAAYSVAYCCSLASGHYYAEPGLTTLNGLLLAAAPSFAWAGELPAMKRAKPWVRAMVRITAVVLPVAVAVALAAIRFARSQADAGEY